MKRTLLLAAGIIAPFALGALFFTYVQSPSYVLTDTDAAVTNARTTTPYLRIFLLGLAMLTGIFFQFLVEATKSRTNVNPKPSYAMLLSKQQQSIVIALLSSPIVFYAIYTLVKNEPDNVIALLIAFQNGFFWQTVLAKRRK